MCRYAGYEKISASGPLLKLALSMKNFKVQGQVMKIMICCLVKKIHHENQKAVVLETDRGYFTLGKAQLILAMGTLPPTTLMLNSFPLLRSIGTRFSSHFTTSIVARTPNLKKDMALELYSLIAAKEHGKLEMGAVYIAGENPVSKHQFHIQLTAVNDEMPMENIYDTLSYLPCMLTIEQLMTSKDHTVFVCACLGQIDHNNPNNWYHCNDDEDITSNATLQVVANDTDYALWDTMDDSTFKILEENLTHGVIEYWCPNGKNNDDVTKGCWQTKRPSKAQIRNPGLVHESSTMWIGKSESDPVDLNYKFRGVDNVYLTGGALWPTGASWNPACTMTGLAMDLADRLNNKIIASQSKL